MGNTWRDQWEIPDETMQWAIPDGTSGQYISLMTEGYGLVRYMMRPVGNTWWDQWAVPDETRRQYHAEKTSGQFMTRPVGRSCRDQWADQPRRGCGASLNKARASCNNPTSNVTKLAPPALIDMWLQKKTHLDKNGSVPLWKIECFP